ncbi:hypothetical protein D9M71_734190 [compost metagenome]
MLNGLFTRPQKRWMVLPDDRLPNWDGMWVLLNVLHSSFELFQHAISRDAAKLGIKGSDVGLLAH